MPPLQYYAVLSNFPPCHFILFYLRDAWDQSPGHAYVSQVLYH